MEKTAVTCNGLRQSFPCRIAMMSGDVFFNRARSNEKTQSQWRRRYAPAMTAIAKTRCAMEPPLAPPLPCRDVTLSL